MVGLLWPANSYPIAVYAANNGADKVYLTSVDQIDLAWDSQNVNETILNWLLRESSTCPLDVDAEGATAPETLRLQDRNEMSLWKVGRMRKALYPTEDVSHLFILDLVILSGSETEGAPFDQDYGYCRICWPLG